MICGSVNANMFVEPALISEERIQTLEEKVLELMMSVSQMTDEINTYKYSSLTPSLDALAEQVRSDEIFITPPNMEGSLIRGTFNGRTLYKKDNSLFIDGVSQ